MRIPILGLLAILIIGIATADGKHPGNSNHESSKNLLSTLLKMHSNLSAQIVELDHMDAAENSEKIHLLQHYIAQMNNIEREIASIQSIDASHEVAAPRHILSPEERTVSSILNIFKKPKNTGQEHLNENNGYPLPNSPNYPDYGQQYPYPYNGQPTNPENPYPSNDLVQGTFPGYEPQNNNYQQQTFTNREQPPAEQVSLQVPQQYTPPPQVMLEPLAQPPQPDPQEAQVQLEPYTSQAEPQQQQYQRHPQFEPYRSQPQPEAYRPQLQPEPYRQQYQPQVQLELYRPKPKEQPQVQPLLRPQPIQNRPQLGSATPDWDAQILQQSQFGQKPGVFVFYPNGEKERPTIADRFGQAFDRVGQVISSLTNRPNLRSSLHSNENRPTYNLPRSSMKNGKLEVKSMTTRDKTMMPTEKPMMPRRKPMMPKDNTMMPTDNTMMPTDNTMMPIDNTMMPTEKAMMPAKPKLQWILV